MTKDYVLKIDGSYIVDVDPQPGNPELAVKATPVLNRARLMTDNMRQMWTMGLAHMLDMDTVKIECLQVERETHVAKDDETPTGYVIKFESNGTYMTDLGTDSLNTTKPELSAEDALNNAIFVNEKDRAEKLAEMFRIQKDIDILPDDLQGDISVLPIVRTTTVLKTL